MYSFHLNQMQCLNREIVYINQTSKIPLNSSIIEESCKPKFINNFVYLVMDKEVLSLNFAKKRLLHLFWDNR